jgi:hypothetical protein
MKAAVVLDIGARPYPYVLIVTANHYIEPDTAEIPYDDISNNTSAWGYVNIFTNLRQNTSPRHNIHLIIPLCAFSVRVV